MLMPTTLMALLLATLGSAKVAAVSPSNTLSPAAMSLLARCTASLLEPSYCRSTPVAATVKDYKDLREYFLAVRFLPAEEQFADMTARFPGFTKEDAANLMELAGTTLGIPHERDCWKA